MGIEDLAKQAGSLLGDNASKIQDALKSDQAEEISDKVLDGAAGVANKVTGGKFEEQVAGVRDTIDKQLGTN